MLGTSAVKLSPLKRLGLWSVAITTMVMAIFLLWSAGLPNKVDYSRVFIEGLGFVAPEIDEIAPPFTAQTLSGTSIQLADLQDESVIINFWATWCIPCAVEMPELQALHDEMEIRILAINIAEPTQVISAWVADYNLTLDILLDPQQEIYRQYRIIGQPTTFVLAPDGIITHIFYGATSADALRTAIETHQANG